MKNKLAPHNLYYLKNQLPPRMGYANRMVKLLKSKRSYSGRVYTPAIIDYVVRGWAKDLNVKTALEQLVTEFGKLSGEPVSLKRPITSADIQHIDSL